MYIRLVTYYFICLYKAQYVPVTINIIKYTNPGSDGLSTAHRNRKIRENIGAGINMNYSFCLILYDIFSSHVLKAD